MAETWTKTVEIDGEQWTFEVGEGWYTLRSPAGKSMFPGDHLDSAEINDLLEEAGKARTHPPD